jgi:serine/threonine-protein kinase
VIHRDVKPDNILLEQGTGRVLVADFGIAGVVAGAGALAAGEVIGTPEFMSPEQALGEAVDARSDLYALGVVGYFALSATLPFEADKATEVLAKQVTEPAPPLAAASPGVPRRLAQAIDRCLAKDPADRPDGTAAFAELLSHALEQRRDLPVALRAFVKHNARLDGSGVLLYPFGLMIAAPLVGWLTGSVPLGFATLAAGYTVVPLGVLVNRARGLLKAGFGHSDLGVAFKAEIERGREERAFGVGHKPSRFERILQWISVVAVGTAGTNLLGILVGGLEPGLVFFTSLMLGVGSGFTVLVMLQRRRDVDSEVWGRLWTGRLGRWLFGLARPFAGRRHFPPRSPTGRRSCRLAWPPSSCTRASRRRRGDSCATFRTWYTGSKRTRNVLAADSRSCRMCWGIPTGSPPTRPSAPATTASSPTSPPSASWCSSGSPTPSPRSRPFA